MPWLGLWAYFCEQSMGSSYILSITATKYCICTSFHFLFSFCMYKVIGCQFCLYKSTYTSILQVQPSFLFLVNGVRPWCRVQPLYSFPFSIISRAPTLRACAFPYLNHATQNDCVRVLLEGEAETDHVLHNSAVVRSTPLHCSAD